MKNHFLMQGLYPVGIAGSYSAGRVVQAPFGENRTYNQSYYIMKMELAKGKRKRDGPVRVLYRPHRSNVSQGQNKKREPPTYVGDSLSSSGALSTAVEPERFIPDTAANSKHRATHGGLPQSLFHR